MVESFLNTTQRDNLLSEKRDCEKRLNDIRTSPLAAVRSVDPVPFQKRLRDINKILETKSAPNVIGAKKDGIDKRRLELEKLIVKDMPTSDEMLGERRKNDVGGMYQEANMDIVYKARKWKENTKAYVKEWKNIMHQLEPNDPSAANVERLRPIGMASKTQDMIR